MTGGRPWRTMRETSPRVWTTAPATRSPYAAGRSTSGPAEPGREQDEEREDVDHHARVEGLGAVEEDLVLDLPDRREAGRRRAGPLAERRHGAVEAGGILGGPGDAEAGPLAERRVALAERGGAQRLAGAAPRVGRRARAREQRPEGREPRERRVSLRGAGASGGRELDDEPGRPDELDRCSSAGSRGRRARRGSSPRAGSACAASQSTRSAAVAWRSSARGAARWW